MAVKDNITRFKEKTQIPENPNDCWKWNAYCSKEGYGRFRYDGLTGYAHRFSYLYFKGKISDDHEIDHICRNRWCVNPSHLEMVTREENIKRAAHFWRKSHCIKGHELFGDNLMLISGKRICRACKNERQKKWKHSLTITPPATKLDRS